MEPYSYLKCAPVAGIGTVLPSQVFKFAVCNTVAICVLLKVLYLSSSNCLQFYNFLKKLTVLSPEVPCILGNSKVHYHVLKRPLCASPELDQCTLCHPILFLEKF